MPRDEYALGEKPAMLAAPKDPDHHIQVARALYSVPTMYLGKRVRVCID